MRVRTHVSVWLPLVVLLASCVDRRDAVSVEVVMTVGATPEEQVAVQDAAAALPGANGLVLESLPCVGETTAETIAVCPVVVRFDVPDEATARDAANELSQLPSVDRVDVTVT